jgi:hypothetical protein
MYRTLFLLFLFSIAMGFMESAIVIYLRELYYPNGFNFPLTVIPPNIAIVEILREAATLIMLLTIGLLAGRNAFEKLTYFLFCFAVWDLFYYVFLKVFLGWPESILTWDILFLIPVPWIGPVLAPCVLSLTMILLTVTMMRHHRNEPVIRLRKVEWFLFITGTLTVIVSFTWDYLKLASMKSSVAGAAEGEELFKDFMNYVPASYNWFIFIAGEILLLLAIWIIYRRRHQAV